MLSNQMLDALNKQINLEFYSSNLYLQMSAWCDKNGYEGAAQFLLTHADEEMGHMRRLFTYVSETGAMPTIGSIEQPPSDYPSLIDLFVSIYEHEVMITGCINDLAHVAFSARDYSTFNFLQWYVSEQHEEEKLFNSIVDKLKMVGSDGNSLFLIDKELAAMAMAPSESIMTESSV